MTTRYRFSRDVRCAVCGGWGWVVLSGHAWKETSADESKWCQCETPQAPTRKPCPDRRCERPANHAGYHMCRGETDGMPWVDEWSAIVWPLEDA